MSQTANALLFKFVMTLVVSGLAFGISGNNSFMWIAVLALAATAIDYLAGDLLILPLVGSFIGAIINGGLGALIALGMARVVPEFVTTTSSVLTFALLIAVGEYFFHRYLLRAEKVEPNPR